jgi:predicted nucleic acid-binding Zn ribbon protein
VSKGDVILPAGAGADPVDAEPTDEARAVFARFRRIFGDGTSRSADSRKRAGKIAGSTVPYGQGREPSGLGDVIDSLTEKLGWNSPLARSELLASWAEIVGAETAEHSSPSGIDGGVLTVACDSTAWATQLRLMRSRVATEIALRFPDAGVEQVRFEGPNAPSWKRGPRTIPGRGPRDTYG